MMAIDKKRKKRVRFLVVFVVYVWRLVFSGMDTCCPTSTVTQHVAESTVSNDMTYGGQNHTVPVGSLYR
jgi:hypothetical protein